MTFGLLAGEAILGAAVGAGRLILLQHVEEYARMARPERRAGARAVQWQIVGGDGDLTGGFVQFGQDVFLRRG